MKGCSTLDSEDLGILGLQASKLSPDALAALAKEAGRITDVDALSALISQFYLKSKVNASPSIQAKADKIRNALSVGDIREALNEKRLNRCGLIFCKKLHQGPGKSSRECLELLSNIGKYTPYKTPATYV